MGKKKKKEVVENVIGLILAKRQTAVADDNHSVARTWVNRVDRLDWIGLELALREGSIVGWQKRRVQLIRQQSDVPWHKHMRVLRGGMGHGAWPCTWIALVGCLAFFYTRNGSSSHFW